LATQILDRNGEVIGKYFIYDRRPIAFNEIPPHLAEALVATEDARFYEHDGIDKRSLLRVLFKTILMQDDSAGGGSTLTQQLAKNLFGRPDAGSLGLVVSKFKEFIIAQRLEDVYSKNEILNLYLNTVPFPDYTFGIESASQKFFNKTTRDLTSNEAAILVGTLKANHSYNPRLFPERAKQRRNVVLSQMIHYGYLKESDTVALSSDTIRLKYQRFDNSGLAPYFREQLRKDLKELLKNYKKSDGSSYDLYRDGLTIYTTLDKKMQIYAEKGMREHMKELQNTYVKAYGKYAPWNKKNILDPSLKNLPYYKRLQKEGLSENQIKDSLNKKEMRHLFKWSIAEKDEAVSISDSLSHYLSLLNCGFIAIDPHTGSVLSYIGGINFDSFKYDHVSQSKRMVGSTFKPFVYTAALEDGMDPCTYYSAEEESYLIKDKIWTPSNAGDEGGKFTSYSLRGALSHSVNTVAVKLILDIGIDKVIKQANKMGIEAKLPFVPSLALGTAEIRLRDLAGAYTSFINDGKPVKPYLITKITDRSGKIIAQFEPEINEKPAMKNFTREAMIEMMKATVNEGTATRLRYKYQLKNDIAGKTGTTQDNKDGWFVSLMPELITVTWVGNDDYRIGFSNTSIGSGANSALPIFAKFLQQLNADTTYTKITQTRFKKPSSSVESALLCESVVNDSTSVKYFFKNIFGSNSSDEKKPIKLDDKGRRIDVEVKVNDNLNDKEEAKERKGFFSFLKRNKKDDDN
ncbi:MAG: transglycosylase domain-containing protein, partial [Leeuwenhoekiella sp.]